MWLGRCVWYRVRVGELEARDGPTPSPVPRPPSPVPRPPSPGSPRRCGNPWLVGLAGLILGGYAFAADYDLDDNGCPDADLMSQLDDDPTDTGVHLAGLDPIEIPTSQRTPELDGTDCYDMEPPTWCEPSFGYLPPDIEVPGFTYPRNRLLLWLVGGGNRTWQMHMIPQTAAYAGYRTINLSWDNDGPADNFEQRCDAGYVPNCGSECLFDVVTEYLTGFDVAPAPGDFDDTYDPHPMHSIEGKLKLALEYLHERDTNLHTTPEEGWENFCTDTDLKWEKIEVAGFSMGAQLASYISYLEPGTNTGGSSIGFLGIDLGVPACEYAAVGGNPDPSDPHYPELLDDTATLPPCGEASGCPSDNRYVIIHEEGFLYTTSAWAGGEVLIDLVDLGFAKEGISYPPVQVDDAIESDELLDTGGHIDQATFGNLLLTGFTTGDNPAGIPWGGHGSMAEDSKLVTDRTSGEFADHAAEYYLLPAYLQAICELSE